MNHSGPLHQYHDVRPCSGTVPYMEWITAQPSNTWTASEVSSHHPEKYTGQRQLHIMPSIALT